MGEVKTILKKNSGKGAQLKFKNSDVSMESNPAKRGPQKVIYPYLKQTNIKLFLIQQIINGLESNTFSVMK